MSHNNLVEYSSLLGAFSIERLVYWGFRSIVVLYLVGAVENGGLGIERQEALDFYALFIMVSGISLIPGGLVCDWLQRKRQLPVILTIAITLCLFLLGVNFDKRISMLLIVLYAILIGLLRPFLYAGIANHLRLKANQASSVYTFMLVILNLAALVAPVLLQIIPGNSNFAAQFYTLTILFAPVVMITKSRHFFRHANTASEELSATTQRVDKVTTLQQTGIIGALVFVGLLMHDMAYHYLMTLGDDYSNNVFASIFSVAATILFGVLFGVIWLKKQVSLRIKYVGAFILAFIVLAANNTGLSAAVGVIQTIIFMEILLAISEMLLLPTAMTHITETIPKKYYATAFAILLSISPLAIAIAGQLS